MVNKKNNNYKFEPDYVSLPGEMLLETIEHIGMTQAELAIRTGRPKKTINEIIKGKAMITSETARQFERVLGVPASFWNNLERNYQEKMAEIEERKSLLQQIEWLKEIPVNAMAKRGWIKSSENKIQQLQEMLNYFGVATVEAWQGVWEKALTGPRFAFRQSAAFTSETGSIAAWIRKGQIDSQEIQCKPFRDTIFKEALEKIRGLTNESPNVFVPQMTQLCANAGVAVIFVPELPGARVSGAAYWMSPQKAIIQLSLRYKTNDHLWFTFFHEAGHILQNLKKTMFLEYKVNKEDERKANKFASETLIPISSYNSFLKKGSFNTRSVEQFAQQINIAPGIVVGFLQHEKLIPYSHLNGLKVYLRWGM